MVSAVSNVKASRPIHGDIGRKGQLSTACRAISEARDTAASDGRETLGKSQRRSVRRIAEAIAANVWLMALLAIPILLGLEHIYHWAHPGAAG